MLGVGLLFGSACSGRNIHKNLHSDPSILVREWTLPTRKTVDPGDRGSDFSHPVMYENTLLFGNQAVGLVALYPGMLQVRWSLPIPGGVVSGLALDRGNVFFGGGDGFFYSVNAENGRVNWRYEVKNPQISTPTVSAGRVFITTSDDVVYAFDAGTGKWLWHYRRRTSPFSTIQGASQPLVDGNEVLVGLTDGFLVSLTLADGQLKWEKKLHQGTKFTDVDAHPVLEEGVLYVPSYDGALYALKRQGGEIIWRFDAGGSKQVLIDGDRLYFPSSDGTIYALQKSNAKVLWKFELDGGVPTRIQANDRYLMLGSSHQYLYVLDKNTGKGLYRMNAGHDSGFYGSPLFVPATKATEFPRLYALSSVGNLYSFSVRKPREAK